MTTIAHRDLRNQSAELLRRAGAGESFDVTNNGVIVARLVPPESSPLERALQAHLVTAASRRRLPRIARVNSTVPTGADPRRSQGWSMSITYVDASAWAKLLVEEAESETLETWVDAELEAETSVVSAQLLMTELLRLAQRVAVAPTAVMESLSVVDLVLPTMADYRTAGLLPGVVRSCDALHVAVALSAEASAFVTYDERQGEAARAAGIPVIAPGC